MAIRRLGSFALGAESAQGASVENLITDYVDLLESQMQAASSERTFNAFYELSEAASAFDSILAVNFPEVRDARMFEYATIFGRGLQHQEPVGKMFGGVNKRMVKQFRMPGYPLVLATTDVLQEGEDLHTFCRRVVHYGITWTPSAMEQRNGRVDRIGSLVQRNLDGSDATPHPAHLIQIFYPYLAGTVEQLQVQTVLKRLNEFLRLIHKTVPGAGPQDSKVDVARAILNVAEVVRPIDSLLESDFPVDSVWLKGDAGAAEAVRPDLTGWEALFARHCQELVERLGIDQLSEHHPHRFAGRVAIAAGRLIRWDQRAGVSRHRQQPLELELRSRQGGDEMLIRCRSPIGQFDLRQDDVLDQLYDLQHELGMVRLCASYSLKHHQYDLSVEFDRLFHSETTQIEELDDLVSRTVIAADRIEQEMLAADGGAENWVRRDETEEVDG